jgi:hypothetical protein
LGKVREKIFQSTSYVKLAVGGIPAILPTAFNQPAQRLKRVGSPDFLQRLILDVLHSIKVITGRNISQSINGTGDITSVTS